MMGILARITGALLAMKSEAAEASRSLGSDAGWEEAEGAVNAPSDEHVGVLRIKSKNYRAVTGNQVRAESIKVELD